MSRSQKRYRSRFSAARWSRRGRLLLLCAGLPGLIGIALRAQEPTPGINDGVAQHLPAVPLHLGAATIQVEIAETEAQRELGLMYVTQLGDNDGMLFVMPHIEPATFWMKNTLIPLSVAFLSAQGVVLDIHDMQPRDLTPVPSDHAAVAYALEMNLHWFALNGIKPGARLQAPGGQLPPPPRS